MGYGRRRYYRLTDRACRQAGVGWHGDGLGLYFVVRPTGSRAFVLRIVTNGRRRDIGLGGFPTTSLADAREKAMECRRLRDQGLDPIADRLAKRLAKRPPTVREMVEEEIGYRKRRWTGAFTEASWKRQFERYVFPVIGDTPVDRVTVRDCSRIVEPIWEGRNSPGYFVRQRLDAVLRRAKTLQYRSDNPARQLLDLLPAVRREPQHHASLPHEQLPSALERFRVSPAPEVVKDALVFIVLTAARLSEGTGAVWPEINLDERKWLVPASRMKASHEHAVPLSRQALEILSRRRQSGNLVFPFRRSDRTVGKVSGETFRYWMGKLKWCSSDGRKAVTHGLRSSFRNWTLADRRFPREAAEAALAHRESATVQAYLHEGPLYDVRVDLMQAWADYVIPGQLS